MVSGMVFIVFGPSGWDHEDLDFSRIEFPVLLPGLQSSGMGRTGGTGVTTGFTCWRESRMKQMASLCLFRQ